jgi:hypothetical protein
MGWLSFAEKEFEPEFEIALSEDLFESKAFEARVRAIRAKGA